LPSFSSSAKAVVQQKRLIAFWTASPGFCFQGQTIEMQRTRHMAEYQIIQVERPDDAVWEAVGGGLHHYNEQQAGPSQGKMLCFVLNGPEQEIAGGLIGETHWGWFYINLLYVRQELRGRGYGHRLLIMAEEAARKLGAKNAYLDTFSFQAPEFYTKHGYRVFGELNDFPPGHQRYYFTKQL
jgi:GNAT superfamily N-acetyltransferase